MSLMKQVDQHKDDETYCAAWLPEGKSFVIRNPDEFARQVVPKFFKATKFSSFTRKLYRWGFRQINRGIGPDDMIIFGNEFFERDNEELMSKMRSITAAGNRKTENRPASGYGKRAFDPMYDGSGAVGGPDQKRYLFDQIMHQNKNGNFMHPNPGLYGGMNHNNGGMHPGMRGPGGGMGMGGMDQGHYQHQHHPHHHPHGQMMGMNKPYDMMPPGGPNPAMMNHHQYNHMHHHQHPPPPPPPPPPQQGMGPPSGGNPQGYNGNPQGYNGNRQGYNGNDQGYSGNGQGYGGGSGGSVGGSSSGGGNNGNNQSTAEIVNAAIRALQFSS
jgi:HSF-type DNA-binding